MKIVIEIPEKTNAHIRSDYGHGVKGLYDEDREILCDAIYHGTPYKERPHGEWIEQYKNDGKWHDMGYFDHMYKCSKCGSDGSQRWHFCPNCGADMRKEGDGE